jgi:hypothetical protein
MVYKPGSADDRNWHVIAYLSFHRSRAYAVRDNKAAVTAADRYAAAIAGQATRVAAIQAGHGQVVEPVRIGRDVELGSWVDPVQTNKFSKAAEKVTGFRRTDELRRLGKRGTLTDHHVAAGYKLRDDHELSEGAQMGGAQMTVRISTSSPGATTCQLDAIARFRAAIQAIGKSQADVVIAVVLLNQTVTTWSERRGMALSRATGYLEGAMDRLVDHYQDVLTSSDIDQAREA